MNDKDDFQTVFSKIEMPQKAVDAVLQLRKIDEITQLTGLTRNQIGLYIKENLIHPAREAQKYFASGVLTQGQLEQLQAVQCLRIHEFGLEEIRYLTICGNEFRSYLQKKSEQKLVLYGNMEDVLNAIAVLQKHQPAGKELEQLRRELRHYDFLPKDPNYRPSFWERHLPAIVLSAALLILLINIFTRLHGLAGKIFGILFLIAIGSLLALAGGCFYLCRQRPPKDYTHQGTAVIEKVDRITGFDSSFAMGKSVVPGSGFREQGQGGIWQIVFMFWNEIRPDNYFPLVTYSHQGTQRIATTRFGGFRHTWKQGDTVSVCWSEADNGLVYPRDTGFMLKKGVIALALGLLLGGVFCMEIGPVTRAANSNFGVDRLSEVLFGMEDDRFEGTEEVSERDILLTFSHFSGTKNYTLNCRAGDCIMIENETNTRGGRVTLIHRLRENVGICSADQTAVDMGKSRRYAYSASGDGVLSLEVIAYRSEGQFHAYVISGSEMTEAAGNALCALADCPTLALKSVSAAGDSVTTTVLYLDGERYCQRTETETAGIITVQQTLSDGSRVYTRTQSGEEGQLSDWSLSPVPAEEPAQIRGLRSNGEKLIHNPQSFSGISCLDGSFYCRMTEENLSSLYQQTLTQLEAMAAALPESQRDSVQKEIDRYRASAYTWGSVSVEMDEASGMAQLFLAAITCRTEQDGAVTTEDIISSIEVMQGTDPAAEIDRALAEIRP